MRVNIVVKRHDLILDEEEIYDCLAIMKDDSLLYRYKHDEDDSKVSVMFMDDSFVLKSVGDQVISETTLLKNGNGKTIVKSPYGDMFFDTKTLEMKKSEGHWHVHYQILADNDVISDFYYEWSINHLQ